MRLIDADDLKAKIMIDAPDFMDGGSSITKAFIMAMLGSRAATPTIDAVQVVRCNDCAYRGKINCPQYYRRAELSDNYFCADGARQESAEDVTGLYCDDITFCWGPCDKFKCPRNKYNIRDKRVPHSFFADGVVPGDCPKQKVKENR